MPIYRETASRAASVAVATPRRAGNVFPIDRQVGPGSPERCSQLPSHEMVIYLHEYRVQGGGVGDLNTVMPRYRGLTGFG
jgi:hypothetical protein